MSMLHALGQSTQQTSPQAFKLASLGYLNKLVGSLHGFDGISPKEATIILGSRFQTERGRVKEAFENIEDCLSVLPKGEKIKVAEHAWAPEGIMPEAWNVMRVEKVAILSDIAEAADKLGDTKLAQDVLREHDRLATLAFDYFSDYGSKLASRLNATLQEQGTEVGEKIATGVLNKSSDMAKKVFSSETLKEYGSNALKAILGGAGTAATGVLGGAGAALGAAPIISHYAKGTADDMMNNARDKALQTAAGTAGVMVGANQLNNLLGRITTAADKGCGGDKYMDKGMPGEDKEDDREAHPIEKMAFHFLIDLVSEDTEVRRQNKIACVYAIHEFIDRETPMFESVEKIAAFAGGAQGGM